LNRFVIKYLLLIGCVYKKIQDTEKLSSHDKMPNNHPKSGGYVQDQGLHGRQNEGELAERSAFPV
jgi:hypothetical protein